MKYFKVFGLWRSGSHYIESILEDNIKGASLEVDFISSSVFRHSLPNPTVVEWIEKGGIGIVAVRNPEAWIESLRKKRADWMSDGVGSMLSMDKKMEDYDWTKKSDDELRMYHKQFIEAWLDTGAEIVSYEEIVLDPIPFLRRFADKNELSLQQPIKYRNNEPLGGWSGYANSKPFNNARFLDIRNNLKYEKVWKRMKLEKIPFYITNLERRNDRMQLLLDITEPERDKLDFNIKQWGPDSKDIDDKLLDDININIYPNWNIESDNPWWNREIKLGEIGCAISHLRMWEDAYEKGHSVAIFGEDDIKFKDDWLLKFKLTIDRLQTKDVEWDLIYLGRVLQPGYEDTPYDKELVIPSYSYCLHSYALSRSGIEKIMKIKYNNNIIPADEFIPAMCGVHPRKDIQEIFKDESFVALAYKGNECLINQLPKDTSGSDTEKSEDYVTS